MEELRKIHLESGAELATDTEIPLSFGNDILGLSAAKTEVAIVDRSHWGLLKISGEDRLRYLHNQSTNDINRLKPGEGCDTVLVNSTGRALDLVTAYITEDSIWVLVSPHCRQKLFKWLDGFIFPFDKVKLTDLTAENAIFTLIGAESGTLISKLGLANIIARSSYHHELITIEDTTVRLAVGSGLALPGYTLIVPVDGAAKVWSKLTEAGAVPIGERVWERLRIEQGRPAVERELTEDYNPLEAGLWYTISFDKGCYIGQETIARLNTYKGVKQRLWGVKLGDRVLPQTPITVDDKKVGVLTSYTDTAEGGFGLAYVKTKAGGAGLSVKVGTTKGVLTDLPFIKHEYPNS
ncbi:MAG: folate-binding protein [Xenococcaceae cyanobacterium MO_188.B32]|nr:folate-binding protein [Xenococcaceae cyanobacterium MO_188.B32]